MSRTNKRSNRYPFPSLKCRSLWRMTFLESFFFFIPLIPSLVLSTREGEAVQALPKISKWRELWQDEDVAVLSICKSEKGRRVTKDDQHHPSETKKFVGTWVRERKAINSVSVCVIPYHGLRSGGSFRLSDSFWWKNHCPDSLICVERCWWWEGRKEGWIEG